MASKTSIGHELIPHIYQTTYYQDQCLPKTIDNTYISASWPLRMLEMVWVDQVRTPHLAVVYLLLSVQNRKNLTM